MPKPRVQDSKLSARVQPSQNPLSGIHHKGKTLGAQHASHGDSGIDRKTTSRNQLKTPSGKN